MKLLNELKKADYKFYGVYGNYTSLGSESMGTRNNCIIQYKKNLDYIPLSTISYTSSHTNYYYLLQQSLLSKKRIQLSLPYLNKILKDFNKKDLEIDKYSKEDYDTIINLIRKEIYSPINLVDSSYFTIYRNSCSAMKLFRGFNHNRLQVHGEYFTGKLMIGKFKNFNIHLNSCFNINKILDNSQAIKEPTPLVYFGVHKSYIPKLKMLLLFNKLDDVDYSKIRLVIDKSVMVRGTNHKKIRSVVNKYFLPACETLNIESLTLDMKEDVIEKKGFGYGVEKFKKFCEKYSDKISNYMGSPPEESIQDYFNY